MSFLDRLRRRVHRQGSDGESQDLRRRSAALGATTIDATRDRERAEVAGLVRSLTYPGAQSHPSLVAELADGTGVVDLVWLGREGIRGISPGVYLRVEGRVAVTEGRRRIYNPRYEIVPG